jgi:chorismate lyase/3-hydroxybenzoate synthase
LATGLAAAKQSAWADWRLKNRSWKYHLQLPILPGDRIDSQRGGGPFAVEYRHPDAARPLLAKAGGILGVVGYGAVRPEGLAPSWPFVAAPLHPEASDGMLEIWTCSSPSLPFRAGPVEGARSADVAFGAVQIDEAGADSLEDAVENAYAAVFDFCAQSGFSAPLRLWNYLTSITGDDAGLERYMRFNVGRERVFSARLCQAVPPAASGVGGHQGTSIIYFLAAREPARAIENPRQVSAFAYPPIYGPRSPSFSRASVYAHAGGEMLFISGTASIVGHETRHKNDLAGQIAETLENLRAVIGAAGIAGGGQWALKIYLLDLDGRALVEAAVDGMFGADCQRVYLRGEICRRDLMVEIEAFCS